MRISWESGVSTGRVAAAACGAVECAPDVGCQEGRPVAFCVEIGFLDIVGKLLRGGRASQPQNDAGWIGRFGAIRSGGRGSGGSRLCS